ncbi:MAG: hypothetical protein AB1847_13890 [bacterium]
MILQANGKISSTAKKDSSRIYAEIRIDKGKYPNFPHNKEGELPVCLFIGQARHQTVIRERNKVKRYWISQKEGLWELLEKHGYSLNDDILLDIETDENPIMIKIGTKK